MTLKEKLELEALIYVAMAEIDWELRQWRREILFLNNVDHFIYEMYTAPPIQRLGV